MNESEKEHLLVLVYLYFRYQKFAKALVLLKVLLKFFPSDSHITCSLSFAYYSLNDAENALAYAEKATQIALKTRQRATALLLKAKALWALGETIKARQAISSYIKIQKTISV